MIRVEEARDENNVRNELCLNSGGRSIGVKLIEKLFIAEQVVPSTGYQADIYLSVK